MKDLKNYGVQELELKEKQNTDGGNLVFHALVYFAEHYVDWFDPDVLPISNDSTGSALDGYMGSRM